MCGGLGESGSLGVRVEELRPRCADQEQRHVAGVADEMGDELERGFGRPVQVFDHQHGRARSRQLFHEPRPRSEVLFALRLFPWEADKRTQATHEPLVVRVASDRIVQLLLDHFGPVALINACMGADDLPQRPEGEAVFHTPGSVPGASCRRSPDARRQGGRAGAGAATCRCPPRR